MLNPVDVNMQTAASCSEINANTTSNATRMWRTFKSTHQASAVNLKGYIIGQWPVNLRRKTATLEVAYVFSFIFQSAATECLFLRRSSNGAQIANSSSQRVVGAREHNSNINNKVQDAHWFNSSC